MKLNIWTVAAVVAGIAIAFAFGHMFPKLKAALTGALPVIH